VHPIIVVNIKTRLLKWNPKYSVVTIFALQTADSNSLLLQVDILESKYPPDARAEMLRGVFSHRHLFQYMLDPIHELLRVDKAWEVHCTDDAFTMSLKSLVSQMQICLAHYIASRTTLPLERALLLIPTGTQPL